MFLSPSRIKVAGLVGEETNQQGMFSAEWEKEAISPHRDREWVTKHIAELLRKVETNGTTVR
jgi:hypothetical protein